VTFALTPAEAERLTWVSTAAAVNLLLRRPDDNGTPAAPGATSPWGEDKDPKGDPTPNSSEKTPSVVFAKVPLAKKDIETGVEVTPDNYDTYFDEIDVTPAVASKALTKEQLMALKDRHVYVKLLRDNWPTTANFDGSAPAAIRTHILTIRSGNATQQYKYNLATRTLMDLAAAAPAPEPAPAPAPKPGEGKE
jgi:hypothetical protein